MTPFDNARERLRLAKEVSLLGLIKELGIKVSETGSYYQALSPFRGEKKGSLMIDKRDINRWSDYGNGKFGDVLDFVKELFGYSHNEAIEYLLGKRNIPIPAYEPIKQDVNPIEIKAVEPLSHPRLIDYIAERKIGLNQAKRYLKQATISFPNGKNPQREYDVLAFENNSHGYEFRGSFLKLSNAPKDVTNINRDISLNKVRIFEGWPDFLSFLTYHHLMEAREDVIVLNSISFLEVIIPFISDRVIIYTGQNDNAGDKAFKRLNEMCRSVIDDRFLFKEYKDFNDFIVGNKIKKRIKIKDILNG